MFAPVKTKLGRLESSRRAGQLAVLDFDLFFAKEGTGLVVVADLAELDLVGDGRGEPGASDDPYFAAIERKLGDVLGEADEIVNVRLSHGSLHGCANLSWNVPKSFPPDETLIYLTSGSIQ